MTRFAATWPARLGAGLFLALLLWDFASPPAAHASCGDHLVAHPVDSPIAAPPADRSPSPPAPCDGPSCSNSKQPPMTAVTVKVTVPEVAARLAEPAGHLGSFRSGWPRRDDTACRVLRADPIFHPPR
jgi:hypothetical protein